MNSPQLSGPDWTPTYVDYMHLSFIAGATRTASGRHAQASRLDAKSSSVRLEGEDQGPAAPLSFARSMAGAIILLG